MKPFNLDINLGIVKYWKNAKNKTLSSLVIFLFNEEKPFCHSRFPESVGLFIYHITTITNFLLICFVVNGVMGNYMVHARFLLL